MTLWNTKLKNWTSVSQFFAEIRKSDGSDYEPDNRRVTLAALDRYLKQNDSNIYSYDEEPKIGQVQTGPRGRSKSSSRRRPRKTTKCNKSTNRPRYGKIVYSANKLQITPLYSVVSALPSFRSSRLPRAPSNICRVFQLEKRRWRHDIRGKPNKDPETDEEPSSQKCLILEVSVIQYSSSKHILPTDLKKCETVACFISPLFKIWNPKCGTGNRRWVSIRLTLSWKIWRKLEVDGRKWTNRSASKEAEGLESAKKSKMLS